MHVSLSVRSEVFALTFLPSPPPLVATCRRRFFFFFCGHTNSARGSKSGDTPVNKTHPETGKKGNKHCVFISEKAPLLCLQSTCEVISDIQEEADSVGFMWGGLTWELLPLTWLGSFYHFYLWWMCTVCELRGSDGSADLRIHVEAERGPASQGRCWSLCFSDIM